MTDVEILLYEVLVTALAPAPVYLAQLPQEVVAPCAVYEVRGQVATPGTAPLWRIEVGVTCLAATRADVDVLAASVMDALLWDVIATTGVRTGPFECVDDSVGLDSVTGLWAADLRWSAVMIRG